MTSVRSVRDVNSLAADLERLTVVGTPGILVHSAISRVGPLADGPATLFTAIREVAGPNTTIVVPTQTTNNSLTSRSFQQAIAGLDPSAIARHIEAIPAFHAETPSHRMGAFAEYVRRLPDAVRSAHPQTSFAAVGPAASAWMAEHDIDCHLGERSPLRALYDADAHVLLIGVGLECSTAFHLAEYRMRWPAPRRAYRCFVRDPDRRELAFVDIHLDDEDFGALGAAFAQRPLVRHGHVGDAPAVTFPVRAAVDFAALWMDKHRAGPSAAVAGDAA